jgi:hypothetical protein
MMMKLLGLLGGERMKSMYIQPAECQAVIDYFHSKRPDRKAISVARYCYDYYTVTDSQGVQWEIKAR